MLRVVVLGAAAGGGVPQWNCGCPVCAAARTDSRAAKHPGLDCDQRRRRSLVPDQRLSRSAPAIDRDAAASSQGRTTSAQPDIGRDPDQWRNRCGSGPAVDARRLAVHDLRARQGAFDPESQQHLQRAEREECQTPADRDRPGVRAGAAGRLAVRHRDPAVRRCRQRRLVSGRQGSPRRQTMAPATRWGFASATRRAESISIFSPPAPG